MKSCRACPLLLGEIGINKRKAGVFLNFVRLNSDGDGAAGRKAGECFREDVRHAVDEVEAGEVEQGVVKEGFFRDDAEDADVSHAVQLFLRAEAGAKPARDHLDQADVARVADGGVHRDNGALRMGVAQKFLEIAHLFRGDGAAERAVDEHLRGFLAREHGAADGPEAVADREVAADAQHDGHTVAPHRLFERERDPRTRHLVEYVETIFHIFPHWQ